MNDNTPTRDCGVKRNEWSQPIPRHDAGWSVSDDTPDGAERFACDDHVSWVLVQIEVSDAD